MPRPLFVAGRGNLLKKMQARLGATGAGASPKVMALCGLGGVGKTTAALTYAHDTLDDYDVVWQFSAENSDTLYEELSQLARQLRPSTTADLADAAAIVASELASRPGRWLLIFDNTPDAASLKHIMPPPGRNGAVLITTRYQHWPLPERLDVPVLSVAHATGFLLRRTAAVTPESAARLATQLGCLPLALEQAAAYMLATGRTMDEYLALLETQRSTLLDRGQPLGYDARVASTWSVSFDYLAARHPESVHLLRLLSCYSPDPVPVHLLLEPSDDKTRRLVDVEGVAGLLNPLTLDEAIAALGRFSLTSPPRHGSVSVHRLVQAVTLDRLAEGERRTYRLTAEFLLEETTPGTPENPESWGVYSQLLPHTLLILNPRSPASFLAARYLWAKGDHISARKLWERITADASGALGPDSDRAFEASNNLALVLFSTGRVDESRQRLQEAIAARRREGSEHEGPLLAAALNNLAAVLQASGEVRAARRSHEEALGIRKRSLGADHSDTLVSLSNLALMLHMQGDVRRGLASFKRVLDARTHTLGARHPDSLLALSYVGMATRACGQVRRAVEIHRRALAMRSEVYGSENPNTLRSMSNLGVALRAYGDVAGAHGVHEKALAIRRRVLGPDHADTLRSLSNLAAVMADEGYPQQALDLLKQVFLKNRDQLGEEHGETLNALEI